MSEEKGRMIKREIHHDSDSILNVMKLELTHGLIGNPHKNVGRDEVMVVLNGEIEVALFSDVGIQEKTVRLQSRRNDWIKIEMNRVHQINVMSDEATILELIGGQFRQGACIDVVK